MRKDVENVISYVDWKATLQEFGEPINNKSKLILNCKSCSNNFVASLSIVKSQIKKGRIICIKCVKTESIRKVLSSPGYKERHSSACKKSYTEERKSRIRQKSKEKWEDPEYRAKQIEIKKKLWETEKFKEAQKAFKTEEFCKSQSEKQRKVSQNQEYKKSISDKIKTVWNDRNYRLNQTEKQIKVWTEERKKMRSEFMKNFMNSPEVHAHYKKIWGSETYRSKLSEAIKKVWNDEWKASSSEKSKELWNDPNYRRGIIEKITERWKDSEYRSLKSKQSIDMWKNESYQQKMGIARARQSGRMSSIEMITSKILDSLSITYESQVPVGHYVFDFKIPGNLFIECQGEYWHSSEYSTSKDAAKASYLERVHPDSKLLYIFEREFMNPNSVTNKIRGFISNEKINVDIVDFDFKDVKIKQIDREKAFEILSIYHYAGFGRSAKYLLGAFLEEKLIAVYKISSPIRNEVASSMGASFKSVLELDRFCIHPKYQKKNFASWFISRASKRVFDEFHDVKHLVSFADMTYGHSGAMYKASNWELVGKTKPDYHYLAPDGFYIHKKTLYNRAHRMSMTEKDYAEKHGYVKSYGREKSKFVLNKLKNL